jgi:hypothetical protein
MSERAAIIMPTPDHYYFIDNQCDRIWLPSEYSSFCKYYPKFWSFSIKINYGGAGPSPKFVKAHGVCYCGLWEKHAP